MDGQGSGAAAQSKSRCVHRHPRGKFACRNAKLIFTDQAHVCEAVDDDTVAAEALDDEAAEALSDALDDKDVATETFGFDGDGAAVDEAVDDKDVATQAFDSDGAVVDEAEEDDAAVDEIVEAVDDEEAAEESTDNESALDEVAAVDDASVPAEDEKVLSCPWCNSTITMSRYDNNQRCYFCKTCRRFWNKGGLLRNAGGGGARKNMPSSSSLSSAFASNSVASSHKGSADKDLEAATVQVDSDGDVSTMCRILNSFVPGASLSRTQVQSLLFLIACFILNLDLAAFCYGQPAGPLFVMNPAARYIILGVIFALALVGLVIAFLLASSEGRCSLAVAKHILPFAYILFLVTVAVGGFGIPFMSSKV